MLVVPPFRLSVLRRHRSALSAGFRGSDHQSPEDALVPILATLAKPVPNPRWLVAHNDGSFMRSLLLTIATCVRGE
jgi:hypothetical protein